MAINRQKPRCPRCRCIPQTCICDAVKPIEVPYRIVVYQHPVEHWLQTNTARLIALSVTSATLVLAHDVDEEARLDALLGDAGAWPIGLFPEPDAVTVEALKQDPRWIRGERPTFVMIDGSWRQARKMRRKLGKRFSMGALALTPATTSRYMLRRQVDPNRLCTAEAAALMLTEIGEGDRPGERLLELLQEHIRRQLKQKGYLALTPDGHAHPGRAPAEDEPDDDDPAPEADFGPEI